MSGGTASAAGVPGSLAGTRTTGSSWSAWINVVAAAFIMVATMPGRTQGLGLITEPMLRDLQVDRVTYATINLWATLLGAAICVPMGRVFDRAGLRWTTVALTLLLAGVVWTMTTLTGGVIALFLLVLATRAIGQSALSVSSITVVGKSFDRTVGLAMGVYSVLLTMLFAAAFTMVGTSVRVHGWRTAWAGIACGLILLAVPAALSIREQPAGAAPDEQAGRHGFPLGAALRTPAFWVFAGATSLFGLVSSRLGLFNEAVLAERGFGQAISVGFLSGTTVVGLVGQMVCGWLTVRWPMQRLLGIALFFYAVALTALPFVTTEPQLWILAVFLGLSGGAITVLFFAVWRHAFGGAHLGRIQGAAQMLTVLASALGPLIFARAASWTGSYFPALWVLAPCVLAFSAVAFRVKLPNPLP